MTPWQKRARFGVAIFGLVFAAVVYRGMGERERAVPPAPLERMDPKAILESTGGRLQRVRGEELDFEIAAGRTLTYEDGSTRQFDVQIDVRGRNGRDYVITSREAHAGAGQQELQLTGDVTLTASDGFRLTTDRGSFSQADGVVRAPGAVAFSKGLMTGSGVGMRYDERSDVLHFSERSRVRTVDAAGGTTLEFTSTAATLDRVQHLLTLEGGVHAVRGGQVIDADRVEARLTESQDVVTFIALRGRSQVSGGSGSLESMRAHDIDLDYADEGDVLERVMMTGGAILVLAGEEGAPGRQLAGESLDLAVAPDGSLTRALGREDVRLELPASGDAPSRSVRASTMDATGVEGKGLTDARFAGAVEYREAGHIDMAPRLAWSKTLETALTGDGIGSAVFTGEVRFEEDAFTATAAEASYQPDEGVLELRGDGGGRSPRVTDAQVTIDATTIEVTLQGRKMLAAGDVRTTMAPAASTRPVDGRSTGASRLPGLLQQDEVANVSAGALDYQGSSGIAVYLGGATLWQGETVIRADRIRIDRETGDLTATGAARSSIALQAGTSDGRAHEIRYDEAKRLITYGAAPTGSGEAQVSGPHGDLRARRIEVVLARERGEVERIDAYTNVAARVEQRTATGARLTYSAEEGRYEVSGSPAVLNVPESCREAAGRTLIFFTSTDRMIVDGNDETRTRTTSGGPCPQPPAR